MFNTLPFPQSIIDRAARQAAFDAIATRAAAQREHRKKALSPRMARLNKATFESEALARRLARKVR